jgi:hypothetical protein
MTFHIQLYIYVYIHTMETAEPERTDNNRGKFESSAAFCLGLFRGPVDPLILVTGSPEYVYLRNNLLDSTRKLLYDSRPY